jgi:uncharacterized membrane protein YdbT with pleckstrin-like domain
VPSAGQFEALRAGSGNVTEPDLPIDNSSEQVLFEGRPAVLPSIGAWLIVVATLGLGFIWFKYRQLRVRYRITSERVVVEWGVLGKRLEQVDLYRINDFVAERPFGQRLVGTGNLLLKTVDRSTPDLELYGLPTDILALYEQLRRATETSKRRHAVRMIDYE